MSEEEFLKYFDKEKPSDAEEYEKRKQALKEHEKHIKENNEKFKKGESTWSEKLYEFSDLPDDEFEKEHTGALNGKGRGLLRPDPENMVDPDSELFFAAV